MDELILQEEDGDNVLADFKQAGNNYMTAEGLMDDIVAILRFFAGKISGSQSSGGQGKQEMQILVEGILSILSHSPLSIRYHEGFQELVWKYLCPGLISLLGTPKAEKSILMQKSLSMEEGVGIARGSARSTSAPNINISTAKIIYLIANELVRLVGNISSLRPVLESLFHRTLLYPPPQHRLDALKAINEVLSSPELVVDLTAPPIQDNGQKSNKMHQDVPLLKLIVDSLQESCHCNDTAVCFTSVTCADQLLGTLERLSKGEGLTENIADEINNCYLDFEKDVFRSSDLHNRSVILEEDGGSVSHSRNSEDEEDDDSDDENTKGLESPKIKLGMIGRQISEVDEEMELKITIQNQLQTAQRQEMARRHRLLRDKFEAVERQNAKLFLLQFKRVLPQLLNMDSISDVDQGLKQFASNFCSGMSSVECGSDDVKDLVSGVILNADGIYTVSILALLLCLKLNIIGYYSNKAAELPLTEKEFLDEALGSGLIVYLSPAWLSEVYVQILTTNILETAGYSKKDDAALINMLKDIDGLDSHEIGGQLLCVVKERCGFMTLTQETTTMSNSRTVEAGKKLAKLILYVCYDEILDVLSVLLNGKSSCGTGNSLALLLGTEGAKEETMRARNAICVSLDGLHKTARLCCTLGLQQRCGSVFTQLAATSCVKEDMKPDGKQHKTGVLPTKPKIARFHAAHVLSMDVVMTTGLEMGSHSADCWKHVFRCCAHISELEHTYFSGGNNQSSLPKVQHGQTTDLNIDMAPPNENELYASPVVPAVHVAPQINILELIRQSSIESGWDNSLTGGGVLTHAQATKALCGLSQEVDSLFEDAAKKLNLVALLSFLTELGESSRLQLRKFNYSDESGTGVGRLPTNALHLYRLQEVLMKVVNGSRPLLHLIRVWSVISPYLVEATGHQDRSISKMAVTCVHEFIVAMLSNHEELPHYHVNEFLCKTFEDMLCLELCDGDVQDQIVCSICEEVEACTAQIQSGWRPLFGALRSVKIEYTANEAVNEARQRHIAAVLDVFDVYLSTDNILVYANATVDCILCLLKYVHGPGMFEYGSDDESDSGSEVCNTAINNENLCIPALKYLKRCCDILTSMWKMPACPPFKGSQRIQLGSSVRLVDPNIPNMNFESFAKHFNPNSSDLEISPDKDPDWVVVPTDIQPDAKSSQSIDSGVIDASQSETSLQNATVAENEWISVPLDELDNPSGILHVWFLLLDGLATSISSCPKTFQPQTLEMLFELLKSAGDTPGPSFAIHCVNHLVLPMLQSWLRRGSRIQGHWEAGAVNFKQCLGHTSDLVVDYLNKFVGDANNHNMLEFMMKQMLDVLTECVAQPVENISRLGCSCIRHVLSSAGPLLTEPMWQISAETLQRTLNVTTYSARQLMTLFHANSENFYGDIGQVKVATRKDCTAIECIRLKQLAHQVFLLESQVSSMTPVKFNMDEDKSFILLLYPPNHEDSLNPDHIMTRVPFRNIVVGLLSHQLLLQTVGYLLLDGAEIKTDPLPDFIPEHIETKLPGLMPYMSTRNALTFLECLQSAYSLACEFDARPGLKFLVQKVAGLDVAANLYKQAGASIVYYVHSLVEICAHSNKLSLETTQNILETLTFSERDTGIISDLLPEWRNSKLGLLTNPDVFPYLLLNACDELCQTYVDILVDKEGTARFDRMEEQPLFFLIAQPDDMAEVTAKKTKRTDSMKSDRGAKSFISQAVTVDTQEETSSYRANSQEGQSESEEEEILNETDQAKSKREIREESESKVYTVATDKTIKSLMAKYKQRKQQNSMPSFVRLVQRMKEVSHKEKIPRREVVDEKIEKQQQTSIMKDSEAHLRSWSEMLIQILQLFLQMDQHRFKSLIPVTFNSNNQLVCHSDDPKLKKTLAAWFHRLGHLYHLAPTKRLVKSEEDMPTTVNQSQTETDSSIDQLEPKNDSATDISQ
ncbi:brefeldin A-inhibited guanine nucleotide-exchange protein 3 [Patella vulgata]|uniref:brefeldin A-inhibited guanine nucleotide-exchange protein 3 n=1 Tax=Patella vulgata TaxID=6465 RepID=UPI0024A81719|nr:brefeldin A-inhibited guanine nucleotide-exchange protein 3 [Patella vulgata]